MPRDEKADRAIDKLRDLRSRMMTLELELSEAGYRSTAQGVYDMRLRCSEIISLLGRTIA